MKSVTVSLLQGRMFGALGIVAFAAGFATSALAHHSAAMFDNTKTVVHTGTVKQFLWTNPHSLLVLSVRNGDGVVEDYSYEANGPGYLVRTGWTREDSEAGRRNNRGVESVVGRSTGREPCGGDTRRRP